ncbi:heterokaryon incompatibility protein-domain-containing protein [Xylaria arbuscula]|nr:heterokaryon incompatibility protein-domain-containing protein [Xylaria arbuscula]
MAATALNSTLPYRPNIDLKRNLSDIKTVYEPIRSGEFRVLQVGGFDSQGCLVTSLHHRRLQEPGQYVAISYTWNEKDKLWYGDYDTSPKPVLINGTMVRVTDKVASIICQALKLGRSYLWIDAVCINQSDLGEKSHQVSSMGSIYRQATEVLAMIGSPSEATDTVFDAANAFVTDSSQILPATAMKQLSNLINGEYWTRAWILQELTLAKSILVCCGTRTTDIRSIAKIGKDFEDRVQNAESLSELWDYRSFVWTALSGFVTQRGFYSAEDLGSLGQGTRESLLEVLENSRHYYGCSDPRDMLYSRLALAADASNLIPHPDYTIAVEESYTRFATNCIMLTKSLKVITFANSTTMNLPSWVPDWSFKQRPWDATGEFTKLSEEIARLRWDEKDLPRISRCRQELMVQGRTLGEVTKRDWLETIASRTMGFSKFSRAYQSSDIPQKGDILCLLRGCPFPIHLRAVKDHFIVVNRHSIGRTYGEEVGLTSIYTRDGGQSEHTVYSLASFEDTQNLPEIVFKIR